MRKKKPKNEKIQNHCFIFVHIKINHQKAICFSMYK